MEQKVSKQLTRYRDLVGRIKVLEAHQVGGGYTVSRLWEDGRLLALHEQAKVKLQTLPSLTLHEQQIEATAHMYLSKYPTGLWLQLQAVKDCQGLTEEDRKLLQELQKKIKAVIVERTGTREGYEGVLDKLAEYQNLQAEKKRVDEVFNVLEVQYPELARLLRLRYIDNLSVKKVCENLAVVDKTYFRWRKKAITQYTQLSGF